MKQIILGIFTLTAFYSQAQNQLDEKSTSAGEVQLTVTNAGTIGNAFNGYRDSTQRPSCRFPANSLKEHLFTSGFWLGGKKNGGNTIHVSSSAIDAPQGYMPGRGGYELTSRNNSLIVERSCYPNSSNYHPEAVAPQDYLIELTDTNQFIPNSSIPIANHSPIGIMVNIEAYAWDSTNLRNVVALKLQVINSSNDFYDDFAIGLYANTVVRDLSVTPAGAGGSAFYNKGSNGYLSSEKMAYCFDNGGDSTNTYIGQKFLGAQDKYGFHHPDIGVFLNQLSGQNEAEIIEVHYNAWRFNDVSAVTYFAPFSDDQMHQKMLNGFNHSPCWDDPFGQPCAGANPNNNFQAELAIPGNRSDLISAGPFKRFEVGDTIEAHFAFVLAEGNGSITGDTLNTDYNQRNLRQNAMAIQNAFNGEDVNFNGVLDAGEDANGDGQITRYRLNNKPVSLAETPAFDPLILENPVQDMIYLKGQANFKEALRIEVSNLAGKSMYQRTYPSGQLQGIKISTWPKGIYILKVYSLDGTSKFRAYRLLKE